MDGNQAFFFLKTTARRDQTFHSAAFPYQSISVITNMEKLSSLVVRKKKEGHSRFHSARPLTKKVNTAHSTNKRT